MHPTNYLDASTQGSDLQGDSLDLFQTGDVMTPWSNPGSHLWSAAADSFSQTNIGVEVGAFHDVGGYKWYTISCRLSNAQALSPSKPQDLTVSVYSGYPKLTWSGNQEPDVLSGGYYPISLRTGPNPWSSWSVIATVPGTTTEYIDYELYGAPNGISDVQYKIQAQDNANKLSAYSDVVATKFDRWVEKGVGDNSQDETSASPVAYSASCAYPNPFNPSTTIRLELPVPSDVSLVVYDVLGREVATLAKGRYGAGYHSVRWDGSSASSGVYYTRLLIRDESGKPQYSKTSKLLLTK